VKGRGVAVFIQDPEIYLSYYDKGWSFDYRKEDEFAEAE
jgi:hypothetical protein